MRIEVPTMSVETGICVQHEFRLNVAAGIQGSLIRGRAPLGNGHGHADARQSAHGYGAAVCVTGRTRHRRAHRRCVPSGDQLFAPKMDCKDITVHSWYIRAGGPNIASCICCLRK
jgi:hypothetical protein